MARTRFLPGMETAPGPHRAMVRDPSRSRRIQFGVRRVHGSDLDRAQRDLANKQLLAARLGGVTLDIIDGVEVPANARSGWNALRDSGHAWLERHLSQVDIPHYNKLFPTKEDAKDHVVHAAKDGLSTDIAFLEAASVTLFPREFDDPNAGIAEWARSSVGFIIEWAGLDDQTDWKLAWALASPKPGTPSEVFTDLHFNPRWFIADPQMQRVRLDPAQAGNLRDTRDKLPQAGQNPRVPLFACPAGNMIPKMHEFVVAQAEEAGLFELTYLEQRANHGYPEAWTALEGIRLATAGDPAETA